MEFRFLLQWEFRFCFNENLDFCFSCSTDHGVRTSKSGQKQSGRNPPSVCTVHSVPAKFMKLNCDRQDSRLTYNLTCSSLAHPKLLHALYWNSTIPIKTTCLPGPLQQRQTQFAHLALTQLITPKIILNLIIGRICILYLYL